MSETAALRAYRARLLAAGRLLEARAVARCIDLLKLQPHTAKPTRQIGAGEAIATPPATTAPASGSGGAWTVLGDW